MGMLACDHSQSPEPPEAVPGPTAGRSMWISEPVYRAQLLPRPVPSLWPQRPVRVARITAGAERAPGLGAAGGGARAHRVK